MTITQEINPVTSHPECEEVEAFGPNTPPEEIADLMIQDLPEKKQHVGIRKEIKATIESPLPAFDDKEKREQRILILKGLQEKIDIGEQARSVMTTKQCGDCILVKSGIGCDTKVVLDSFAETGEKAKTLLASVSEKRRRGERPIVLARMFPAWVANETRIKRADTSKAEALNMILQNNGIMMEFISALYDTPNDERDSLINTVFSRLSDRMKEKFLDSGFINGVIAETYVFDQLSAENGWSVRTSTQEEDVREHFDLAITLPNGKVIKIDAKSHIPAEIIKNDESLHAKDPHFARKGSSYKPIYAIQPNIGRVGQDYLGTRMLGGREILSFSKQPAVLPKKSFAKLVWEVLNTDVGELASRLTR